MVLFYDHTFVAFVVLFRVEQVLLVHMHDSRNYKYQIFVPLVSEFASNIFHLVFFLLPSEIMDIFCLGKKEDQI